MSDDQGDEAVLDEEMSSGSDGSDSALAAVERAELDPQREMWREAWDWRQTQEKEQRAEQILKLREFRANVHQEAMTIEEALARLEGRGDWTQLMHSLQELNWLHVEPPERVVLLEYAGECVLPMGKVGFFVGEGGIGKSWALTQLGVSVATGTRWLDTFSVPRGSEGGVVMAMGEEDVDEMHRRIHTIVKNLPLAAHELSALEQRLWPLALSGYFMEFLEAGERSFEYERFEQLLRERAPVEGWKLVILDPASRFMGVDAEKDNAFATRFVQLLERLTKLPGNPTVLCAHHTTKAARTSSAGSKSVAARGASALTDGARWQGNLFAPLDEENNAIQEGISVFQVTKSNYGPKPAPLFLMREEQSGVLVPFDPERVQVQPKTLNQSSHFSEDDTNHFNLNDLVPRSERAGDGPKVKTSATVRLSRGLSSRATPAAAKPGKGSARSRHMYELDFDEDDLT